MSDLEQVARIVDEVVKLKKELFLSYPSVRVDLEKGEVLFHYSNAIKFEDLERELSHIEKQLNRLKRLMELLPEFRRYKELAKRLVGIINLVERMGD